MQHTFGDPYYDDDKKAFNADIVAVQENEDDQWDWHIQEEERRSALRNRIDEVLTSTAIVQEWLIWKIYYFLYFRKNFEVHINRVKPMIHEWILASTYEQLIDARIITEEDVISNFKF